MEEFTKELIDLFNKHGLMVMKGSVAIECSPVHISPSPNLSYRDVTFSFRQVLIDSKEIKELIERDGVSVSL